MPLPIAHGLLGASIVAALHPQPTKRYLTPVVVAGLLANAADFDFFLVFAFHDKSWHRGFSHSITLALVFGLALVLFFGRRQIKTAIAYGLAFASHGILDYLTTKEGIGVELLWPFNSDRLALGWVGLSELPSRLPAIQIAKWLMVEFTVFAPLLVLMIGLRKYVCGPTIDESARSRKNR